jgi:dynamin 1-like protein
MAMDAKLFENLRQLITLVDELRDVGLQHYISLPRIAAIGTQSSGKSSLIESIVGLDFLPRGGGVVTRRPLELRLVHLNTQEYPADTSWAIFEKLPNQKFTDFDKVREQINKDTDEVAGANKGIVKEPIVLTIYSTGAPDLTLIDLPGITRVPVKGSDQTEDIEKLTRDMTLHYINDTRTLVLAVLPANQDMSVSDSLQLARQVDPKGLRSIGVVTKIDIMDQGTDACKMLRGEDIPLRLGYVGVRMRSQQDIDQKKKVSESLKDEEDWFNNHRLYGKLPPGLVGTKVLVEKLTQEFFKHIRRFLPQIKKDINEKRRSVQDRLDELGQGVPLDDSARTQVMWTMMTDFCEMFKNTIRGKSDRKLQKYLANLPPGDGAASGGMRVRSIMNDFLGEFLDCRITAEITDDEMDRAIRMHEGDSLPGFPSPDTFEYLVLPHLQKIAIPSVECVHNVASALDVLAQRMSHAVFRRFPSLQSCCLEMTQNIIAREKEAARIIVEQQVNSYTGYLFTNDPLYLTEHGSMEPMYKDQKPPPPPVQEVQEPGRAEKAFGEVKDHATRGYQTTKASIDGLMGKPAQRREQKYSGPFVDEMRKRLDAYFAITVRSVRDIVPKAIGFYLVRAVQEKMQYELLQTLNSRDKMSELLGEPPHIHEERRVLTKQLEVLQNANNVLTRDPTLASIAFEAEADFEEPQQPAARPPAKATTGAASLGSSGNALGGLAKPTTPGVPQQTLGAPGGSGLGGSFSQPKTMGAPSGLSGGRPPTSAGLFNEDPKPAATKPATKNPLFGD